MKWFYLLGLLLLGVVWCKADENDLQDITKGGDSNEGFDLYSSLKELFAKTCQEVGGDSAVKNLTRVIDGLRLCLGDNLPTNTDELKDLQNSGSSEELCSERRAKVRGCFDDFVDVWKACSKPEEKYLPEFAFNALDAVFDYICADDGANILKLFDPDALDCVMTLAEKENVTQVCNDQLKFLKEDTPEEFTITKAELCQDLNIAKACFGDYLREQCPKDTNFRDVIAGLYNAMSSPCRQRNKRNPLGLRLPY